MNGGDKSPWSVSAEDEYNRDDKLKRGDVQALLEWMKTQPHLPPNVDEEMIVHLYHACYYNVERAKSTIEAYYTYRSTMPDLFDNWDPSDTEMQRIINTVLIAAPLPDKDKDGNKVMVCKLRECEASKFNQAACTKWLIMCANLELWREGTHKGYAIVYDASGFSTAHMLKCSLSTVKNYINFGTYASPMRVVKVVVINTSPVIKKLFTLIKPFLSKEIISMMSFHTDSEAFFKDFSMESKPVDYGGSGESLEQLHSKLVQSMMEYREYIVKEESYRSDESKRINSKKKSKESPTKEKSIKHLEID